MNKRFSVTRYAGIAERPAVILLNRKAGEFRNQFDDVEAVKAHLKGEAVYFVADASDKRFEGLHVIKSRVIAGGIAN